MTAIFLPRTFARYYLGKITSLWIALYGITPDEGYKPEFHVFMREIFDEAVAVGDRSLLLLLATSLLKLPAYEVVAYNESEPDWTETDVQLILHEILTNASREEVCILTFLSQNVRWTDMPLRDWNLGQKQLLQTSLSKSGIAT
jgi:hypothetical protein